MAITPLSSVAGGIPGTSGPSSIGKGAESFGKVMRGQTGAKPLETEPLRAVKPQGPVTEAKGVAHARGGQKVAGVEPTQPLVASKMLDQVQAAQARMDQVLKLAESGRSFSPAELLSLQAHVYRASQELDLAGKVVEKATGGLKQVLQTQV